MSRLHRKCLFASSLFHGLLFVVLLITSAFVEPPPEPPLQLPLLDIIPDKVVDAALYGGGDPEVQPAPPPPVQKPAPALVQKVEPEPVKREPEPERKAAPIVPTRQPEPKPAKPKPVQPKPAIKVAKETTRVNQPVRRTEESKARPDVAKELESRLSDMTERLSRKLTPKTTITVPGPGGEAYANYSQVVISIYQAAWIQPMGIEKNATVKATVTIARDGRVLSAKITRLSGNRTVDDSVDQVLQRVKNVRPFPEGARDATRTFDLSFELTPADLSG